MKYYAVVLLMYLPCESVIGQIPPIFGAQVPSFPTEPILGPGSINDISSYIINNGRQIVNPDVQCYCALNSTCTGTPQVPGNNFDVRIINTGPTNPQSCPTGYVFCCGGVPQPTNPQCGRRKVSVTNTVGDVAPYGAYPWQAALFDRMTDQYICAGVVISTNYIITVAHRVFNLNNNFRIRLGIWSLSATSYPYFDAYPVFTQLHVNFNRNTLQNDIAIIQLDRPIPFANYANINTACLPTSIPTAGTRCWTAGWGVNSFNNGQYQSQLRQVEVPIVSQASCETSLRNTRLGNFFTLDQTSFICAGGQSGKDACTGDGGGALVCEVATNQFQVVGLTAWGIGCGQSLVPGVYVNVYSYLSFIRNYVSSTANAG